MVRRLALRKVGAFLAESAFSEENRGRNFRVTQDKVFFKDHTVTHAANPTIRGDGQTGRRIRITAAVIRCAKAALGIPFTLHANCGGETVPRSAESVEVEQMCLF